MQKKDIKKIFSSHISVPFGTKPPSAVLVPLMEKENGINVVFTQRALHMIHQPGDICFPGGHHENSETAEETAIRETYEELGIKKENIEIIGRPDYMLTKYGAYVIPFIGFLKNIDEKDFIINPDEVEKVILIPLNFFMETEPKKSYIELKRSFPDDFPFDMIYGGKNYKFAPIKEYHYFYDYNGIYIWGLTAKIIKNVAEILSQQK